MLVKGNLPTNNYNGVKDSFDFLPEDQYAEPGYRFRRYSKFTYKNGKLEFVDTDHFMQSKELNSEFGDIERKFEPIMPGMLTYDGFQNMFFAFNMHTGCTEIDCHQVRIVVPHDREVPAAPEGRHQDGYDYIGAFIVTRDNITGGKLMVWEDNHPDSPPIFMEDLHGGYGIIDDKKYWHTGDDLGVVDKSRPGLWEWFVLGGRHGSD